MTERALGRHPFLRWQLAVLRPHLLVSMSTFEPRQDRAARHAANGRRLAQHEFYVRRLLNRSANMLAVLDRVALSRRLIALDPRKALPGSRVIDRASWTEYHFLVFTASLTTVVDCAALLVSECYRLGIADRDCKTNLVVANLWIKGTPVAESLDNLNKALAGHQARRNRYLHRGERPELFELAKEFEWFQDLGFMTRVSRPRAVRQLSPVWRFALQEARAEMERASRETVSRVGDVFSSIQPVAWQEFEDQGGSVSVRRRLGRRGVSTDTPRT